MRIAVAGLTGLIAKHPVNAAGEMFGFLIMTGQTLNLRHFGGMRIVLDRPVAIGARQNAVNAGGMLLWVHGNAVAAVWLHSGLPVAPKALSVGLRNEGLFCLGWQQRG